MKRTSHHIGVAFIALLAAAGVSIILWNGFVIHAAQVRIAQKEEQNARLAREATAANRKLATVAPVAASKPDSSPMPTAKPEVPKPPGMMDIARNDPPLMSLWVADQRSKLQQRYGMLFQNLRLTPEQRSKFKDIVAASFGRSLDISAAAKEKGLSYDDPVIRRLQEDSERQKDADLRALLGEDGFTAYSRFNESVRLRGFVDGFAVQVAETEPLTPQQAEKLAQTLVAASAPMKDKDRDIDPMTVDWAQVDRLAQSILTPGQFAAWQRGVAHNPYGGSRNDQILTKIYEAAKARDTAPTP